jgi:hypothetical protein
MNALLLVDAVRIILILFIILRILWLFVAIYLIAVYHMVDLLMMISLSTTDVTVLD